VVGIGEGDIEVGETVAEPEIVSGGNVKVTEANSQNC